VVRGGGFPEGVGGHNPLEPAQLGVGVVSGPHFANHADIYGEMIAAGAARVAADEPGLSAILQDLWSDPAKRTRLAAAAAAYAATQRGQLGVALEQIRSLLPARQVAEPRS
jgi:3-deoxy-D-manno-octulosonic-acid transferase